MTESEKLTALAAEARARGISYGQLMALTTRIEREEILDRYEREGPARAAARRDKLAQAGKERRMKRRKAKKKKE